VIVIADISLSLDNVLAVAGAAHGNIILLGIGLVFSIIMMAFASNLIAKLLNRIPIIQWVGLLVILGAALGMVLSGSDEVSGILKIPGLLSIIMVGIGTLFVVVHQLAVRKEAENKFRIWLSKNYLSVIIVLFVIVAVLLL
jgi:predicted tellurium resistance membrane protein TerC